MHHWYLAIRGGAPSVQIPAPHFRWPLIGPDEEAAVLAQLRSGELSYYRRGGVIAELEDAFAASVGVPYAVSTCSGTAALHAAYFGLDLAPGDEVIAPAYTHLATVVPSLQVGLIPVLCDVDERTGNIDVADAAQRITPRTRSIVVTHQYGHLCDMAAVLSLASRHGLKVIEDASHAHGSTFEGRQAGSFGNAGCFSLQSHKVVVAGEGGLLVTTDPHLLERACLLGHFRQPSPVTSPELLPFVETGYGQKNRLHPLAAALALTFLRKLPERLAQRRDNLEYFAECLQSVPGVEPLPTLPGFSRGPYFRFLVRYKPEELSGVSLERYLEALRAEGVREVMPGSLAKPLHLTALFQTLDDRMYVTGWPRRGGHVGEVRSYRAGDFPKAERFSASTLQFPAFTEPSRHIIDAYCEAMRKVAQYAGELC